MTVLYINFNKADFLFIKFGDVLGKSVMSEMFKILITGGTSGLGMELVRHFLEKGFFVVTTGRRKIEVSGYEDRLSLYRTDFCDLRQTADIFRKICTKHTFDYVIYNAGILSPSEFVKTDDGFELTYQVNFLAHLLANEIIIQHHDKFKPLRVAAVTSMAYRVAVPRFTPVRSPFEYRAWRAYSDSKLYLALMCRYYSGQFKDRNIEFFSFDPGIFSSELYRTQSGIFRIIYKTGVKILRKPAKPAVILSDILTRSDIKVGGVYDVQKRIRNLPELESGIIKSFWSVAIKELDQFLR